MGTTITGFEKMCATDTNDMIELRRQLHALPELSEREQTTSATILQQLQETAATNIVSGLGSMQTGICAVYDSGLPGPVVLLRAELDALPIDESNTFAHRSSVPGVSHKCGHDGHMATLVAVARQLQARPVARGRVYLLFQPAEETGTGALAVLEDPRFQALQAPDYVYAFHNVPKFPLGQVLLRKGLFAQASVGFIAEFHGTTSHASYPEFGINPSLAVTELVSAVNSFDKNLAAQVAEPILATTSYAQLGNAEKGPNFGTTPGSGVVMGVLRAHGNADLDLVRQSLEALVAGLAEENGLTFDLGWHESFAATESDDVCVDSIETAAQAAKLDVQHLVEPFRWSEDFGRFTDAYSGAFFGLGSGVEQPQLHENSYDYPDELIAIGARLYRAILEQHLG